MEDRNDADRINRLSEVAVIFGEGKERIHLLIFINSFNSLLNSSSLLILLNFSFHFHAFFLHFLHCELQFHYFDLFCYVFHSFRTFFVFLITFVIWSSSLLLINIKKSAIRSIEITLLILFFNFFFIFVLMEISCLLLLLLFYLNKNFSFFR